MSEQREKKSHSKSLSTTFSLDDISEEERKIKEFQRQTFIVFIVAVTLFLLAVIIIIVGGWLYFGSKQVAPEKINAPQPVLTQGLLIISSNQNFWAAFATDFAVYKQSTTPSDNTQ